MRASFLILAGVALSLAAPAIADPAYTSGKVVDFLLQSKSSKLGKSRGLHLDEPATAQPEAQPKHFDLMVNFEFNSDRLTAAAQANLDQFAAALRDPRVKENLKGEKFAIDGFTDATGDRILQPDAVAAPRPAVVNYLQQHGVDRSALIAKGFGPTNPRAPDPFDPINRRVETHLVGLSAPRVADQAPALERRRQRRPAACHRSRRRNSRRPSAGAGSPRPSPGSSSALRR